MCEYCVKHGEGKKWYLQAKNYSEDLWNDIKKKKVAREHFGVITTIAKRELKILKFISGKFPFLGLQLLKAFNKKFRQKHLGQVVPIEDVENVLGIVNSVVRIPCVCRKSTTNKEVRYCFALSINPKSIGMAQFVNKNYCNGPDVSFFEKVDKKTALAFMKNLETSKTIHTVWTVSTPFVAFICNCGDDGCLPMLSYRSVGPVIMKGEYVSDVDDRTCKRCKKCVNICLFDAIAYDTNSDKIVIDKGKCYGCGICRSVCETSSVRLVDRAAISEVANLVKQI
ncbi:ATP-binding protein [Candidatus Omnitrophota bacterium]